MSSAWDTIAFILKILGSLGVFLYGMKVMSEGIQRTAGDGLRKIMATMTHNRFLGAGTGLLTTGLIQSSSATTVMVVSFVNAGLLTLVESIGVIMGANLGTTLTAWIIALVGKFSLSKIAIPIIGVGLPLFFAGKNKWKSFGEVLIGFGLLFYGLHLLKDSVPDVKGMLASTDPEMVARATGIQDFVGKISGHGYLSILAFLTVGVILTLVVQSSSAAMAITVTMAIQGWIGFHDSCAIVLGENIGTTVTAWLASLGTTVNARRAARAHFLFNIIGVVWLLAIFYWFANNAGSLAEFLPESFQADKHKFEGDDSGVGFKLAIFHTVFNLLNICLLIGFVPHIARLVTRWVKDETPAGHRSPRLQFISGGLVQLGDLNIPEAEKATSELAGITKDMFDGYLEVLKDPNSDLSAEVKRLKVLEDDADVLTHDITDYLVRTSAGEISAESSRAASQMHREVSELEEISDAIYRLIQITQRKYRKGRPFEDAATENILTFADKVGELITLYTEVLTSGEASSATLKRARDIEDETDSLRKKFNKAARRRMDESEAPDAVQTELITMDIHNQFELIANYGLNVVQTAYYGSHSDKIPEKYDI